MVLYTSWKQLLQPRQQRDVATTSPSAFPSVWSHLERLGLRQCPNTAIHNDLLDLCLIKWRKRAKIYHSLSCTIWHPVIFGLFRANYVFSTLTKFGNTCPFLVYIWLFYWVWLLGARSGADKIKVTLCFIMRGACVVLLERLLGSKANKNVTMNYDITSVLFVSCECQKNVI